MVLLRLELFLLFFLIYIHKTKTKVIIDRREEKDL